MQLKTLGESLTVLDSITSVLNLTQDNLSEQGMGLFAIGEANNKSIIKQAISRSKLNEEQIESILIGAGLEKQELKTTTSELAQITATNILSASQSGATVTTLGFSTALKGLAVKFKEVTASICAASI